MVGTVGKKILMCFAVVCVACSVVIAVVEPEHALQNVLTRWMNIHGIQRTTKMLPGYTVRYYEGGSENKETVVLLHGIGGNAATSWFRLLPKLAATYHVLAPDLISANFSALTNTSQYSLLMDKNLVQVLLRDRGVTSAQFVGVSFGGLLALHLAAERPALVTSLALITPVGYDVDALAANLNAQGDNAGKWFYQNLFQHPLPVPDVLLAGQYDRINILAHNIPSLLKQICARETLLPDLAGITQPTMVIWGKEDKIFPIATARPVVDAISDVDFLVYEDCGHGVVWDQPELLERNLVTFLSNHTKKGRVNGTD